jgi:hypothetical protein
MSIEDIEGELDFLPQDGESRKKLVKAVREFRGYIEANQNFIPNYGDRYRHGEISTAFAESAVNQVVSKRMVKKQQMRWSESGAHNLLQVRTKVLNNQLRETSFAGIRECEPNRRRKLRRRPRSPQFEMLSSPSAFADVGELVGKARQGVNLENGIRKIDTRKQRVYLVFQPQ